MEKILVFGHKSPDTDTIASSIAMAYLQTKLGKVAVPHRLVLIPVRWLVV